MEQKVMEFQKFLERELEADIENVIGAGSISPADICMMKDAFKLMKLIGEYEETGGYSTRRGRSRVTGRYMSRDDGSYDGVSNRSYDGMSNRSYDGSYRGTYRGSYERSGHTQIVSELERMYDNAHDEKERKMIGEWIQRAEQN